MDDRLLGALADSVVSSIRKEFAKVMGDLPARITDEVARAVAALPKPQDGKDADPGLILQLVSDEVASSVEAMVKALPKPADGKDADPSVIKLMVAEEVAKVPPASDGKSVTVDDVRPLIEELVAALPVPADGKDVDPAVIKLMVAEEVAKVPPASDGKSVTLDDVRPLIDEVVGKIPKPLDGKDADPAIIKLMVAEEVAKVPPASDGRSVTLDDVRPLIDEAVGRIPKPQDGKSVDPDEIAALVQQEVAKLPPAQPGKDVDPELVQRMVDALERCEVQIKALNDEVKMLRAQPVAPASFLINEDGALLSVYPDGSTKSIGRVRGEDGDRGASIMDGNVDDDGLLILRMSDGRILNAGIVRGKDGKDGPPGGMGRPGRDQLEMQPIPGIDESKSYPEGVCAHYRGGVIRAERQTDPIENGDIARAGWAIAMEGIAEETEHPLDDGRVLERTTFYTGGRTFTRRIDTAMPIYHGVWKEGTYRRGDMVSKQGAVWHCNQETTDVPGNGSTDWRLAVKSARDGKDGKDGKIGPKGLDGRNGRDLTHL